MTSGTVRLNLSGDFEVVVGSDSGCEAVLDALEPKHAKIKRVGDRVFIKDLSRSRRTFVNRKLTSHRRWQEVTRFDEILLGDSILNLSPKFFIGRDRTGLDTSRLFYRLPSGRTLCEGVYLRAQPGTLTGIVGPAGSGKTVFLDLLNGYLRPTDGRIWIGERYDPHHDWSVVRDYVGYVPQDDALLGELTPRESLDYRLRLKFPDMARSMRERLIRDCCRRMGSDDCRLDLFLDTLIGYPGKRGLSGGERKRANIAHELISKPLVLILDEPTSGLSSADADEIVRLLHRLAKEEQLTVIATLHRPSLDAFERLDDLMVMTHGGRVAYYGPAARAREYVRLTTGTRCDAINPADYLMEQISCNGSDFSEKFEEVSRNRGFAPPPYAEESAVRHPSVHRGLSLGFPTFFLQWWTLIARNLRVMTRDWANLGLAFGQIPIIALLILCAFAGYRVDTESLDRFATRIQLFDQAKAPVEASNRTVYADHLIKQAIQRADEGDLGLSPSGAYRRASVYFILVAAAIWFGIMGSSREIVADLPALRRERRVCLNLAAYFSGKTVVQLLLTGIQTVGLSFLVAPVLLDLPSSATVSLWVVLWVVAISAACLGLLISSVAPTYRFALTAVPLVMIPQLVFGGLLRPEVDVSTAAVAPRAAALLSLQRWGFAGALPVDEASGVSVFSQDVRENWSGRYWELNLIKFEKTTLYKSFFRDDGNKSRPVVVLIFVALGFCCLGYVVLRLRLT